MPESHIRSFLRHPLSLLGGGIAFFGFFSILAMFLIEAFLGKTNPYIGVFTYVVYPLFLFIGLLLIPIGALLQRRRRVRGGELPPYPRIDLNEARSRAIFLSVIGATVLILAMVSTVSYRAYQFTDSVGFCGELCHSVMKPEYTAYQASPHSRVACVDCHVGPGATWFVRSKLSGVYQIYSVLFNNFPRPITTPIESLRPARETCEQCHWPEKFFGAQLKVINRFGYDEKNSLTQIQMLIRTGGGSPTGGITTGIHWHMNIANEVWYRALDPQRQKIPWVRVKDTQGRVTEYRDRTVEITPDELKANVARRMDCMDCHNRPTHIFRDPDTAIDQAIQNGLIDRSLPYIKREAVRVLAAPYPDTERAREGIATSVDRFYLLQYPLLYEKKAGSIKKAITEIQRIYQTNYFPEMKVDWRTHPDNIGHTLFPGCFRCHDGKHVSQDGRVITKDCQACHTVIGQETKVASTATVQMAGIFKHPWELKGKHASLNCNRCHVRGRGIERECTTCHPWPAGAPMEFPCSQCHPEDQISKPTVACATCHPPLSGLHRNPVHSTVGCTSCHLPHQWKVAGRQACVHCHQDKTTHYVDGACQSCHLFR